jgi:hypothetical protein
MKARTKEALEKALVEALNSITKSDIQERIHRFHIDLYTVLLYQITLFRAKIYFFALKEIFD